MDDPLPPESAAGSVAGDFLARAQYEYWSREAAAHRAPGSLDFEAVWRDVEAQRRLAPTIRLCDQSRQPLRFFMTPKIQELLHRIDTRGADSMFTEVEGSLRMQIVAETLLSEALRSSQIEGAVTTFAIAEKLVREQRPPRTKDEQMVLNNYRAMEWILRDRSRPFTSAMVCDLHAVITKDALEHRGEFAGRFRDAGVAIRDNATDAIVYEAPAAAEVEAYFRTLEAWLSQAREYEFLHPVVRASILHFYFVYVHPFFDGNGRTARALFYWYALRNGYDSFRYLSISSAIHEHRGRYYTAIQRCEDERDVTAFVLFSCEIVSEAIEGVRARLASEFATKRIEQRLAERELVVTERQAKLLKSCLKNPARKVTIGDHQKAEDVVYETARQDVLELERMGILRSIGKRKKQVLYSLNETFFL